MIRDGCTREFGGKKGMGMEVKHRKRKNGEFKIDRYKEKRDWGVRK